MLNPGLSLPPASPWQKLSASTGECSRIFPQAQHSSSANTFPTQKFLGVLQQALSTMSNIFLRNSVPFQEGNNRQPHVCSVAKGIFQQQGINLYVDIQPHPMSSVKLPKYMTSILVVLVASIYTAIPPPYSEKNIWYFI